MSVDGEATLIRAHPRATTNRIDGMWYAGLDVHQAATVITVRNRKGEILVRGTVATTAAALRHFFASIRGKGRVTCESGPMAPWVAQILATRMREVVVSDARRNSLLAVGAKHDRIDADKLSELLRLGAIHPVYVGDALTRELRQLVAHYRRSIGDRTRIIQRLRSTFRECGIRVATHRGDPSRVPLRRLPRTAIRQVTAAYLRQLAVATEVKEEARATLLRIAASRPEFDLLQSIPFVGPVRAAELIAIVDDPWRFRSVRQFWSYAGLAVVQRMSSDQKTNEGSPSKTAKPRGVRLNRACQPHLRRLLREVAMYGSLRSGPLQRVYNYHIARGKRPAVARIALARKVASALLCIWRHGEPFSERHFKIPKSGKSSRRASLCLFGRVVDTAAETLC